MKRILLSGFLMFCAAVGATQAVAADEEDIRPRRFLGRYIQLDPIMVPFQTVQGIRFEVTTVRLVIGENSTARPACFIAPYLHEKILMYLWQRGITAADFEGARKSALEGALLEFVTKETAKGYYSAVEVVGGYEEIDQDSQNLSTLCK